MTDDALSIIGHIFCSLGRLKSELRYLQEFESMDHFNSGIGINKIREITNDERCEFVPWIGNKRLIKWCLFDAHIEQVYSIYSILYRFVSLNVIQ